MIDLTLGAPVRFTRHLSRRSDWNDRTAVFSKFWTAEGYPGQREPEPRDGIIVGVRTLTNGNNQGGSGYDDPIWYRPTERFRAYLVAFNLRQRPVLVLPEHILEPVTA